MPIAKQRVLFFGNCQGGWLSGALMRTQAITERYEIVYLSDYYERPADHPIHNPDFLPSCSCVIWQTASGCKPPDFLDGVPASCRQIRYPTLWLKLLWPTYAVDPRNKPEPGFPWGKYPYGDRLVMKLLDAGVPLEDLPKRYIDTDLNTIVNLTRFTEMSLTELRLNDKQSDLAIAPFIESTFRQRKLFGSVNHPTMLILSRLYQDLVGAMLNIQIPTNILPPEDAADTLGMQEVPLHPQIIEFHQLAWARPEMKWRYNTAFLTISEYIRAYAAFEPIPLGDTPALWIARAQQAIDYKDFSEAQRLLLQGASKFPQAVQFLQYLGLLLLQQDKLADAESVYRCAISLHPNVADLHYKLGVILLRRQSVTQARLSFEATLKLDPGHAGAKQHLASLSTVH